MVLLNVFVVLKKIQLAANAEQFLHASTGREIPVRDDDSGPNGKLLSYRQ